VKYAFIQQQTQWAVKMLCRVLQVSRSGYYDWLRREPSQRKVANAQLLQHIQVAHTQHRQAYGALKTWRHLNKIGIACGKHRVARLRVEAGIEAKRKTRFRLTVEHHNTPQAAPDLLKRQFTTDSPNRAWVGDMTFIRTRQGWLHLAVLLDLYSRKVVGWAFGNKANTQLHQQALSMAVIQRKPQAGLIHHTDRGAVYSAAPYRVQLAQANIIPSMNGRKTAYDNAVAESFFSNLKNEWVHHHDFNTREEAGLAIFDYIECFYNTQRMHQSLGYLTPVEMEKRYHAQQCA
jgi:transposase InsO family protein